MFQKFHKLQNEINSYFSKKTFSPSSNFFFNFERTPNSSSRVLTMCVIHNGPAIHLISTIDIYDKLVIARGQKKFNLF